MASFALSLGGAAINAIAFTSGNYLFSKLFGDDDGEEIKRHNLTMEQLQKATIAWGENRSNTLDWENERLYREMHSAQTFQDVNNSVVNYEQTFLTPEPKLSDFYTPSESQKIKN